MQAAKRELAQETGVHVDSPLVDLGALRQPSRKIVHVWAACQDVDHTAIRSNDFSIEWPPKSGTLRTFPEVDRAEWFSTAVAANKLHKGQVPFLDRLHEVLERTGSAAAHRAYSC